MNKIIVINGNGGVGKDTFVECCVIASNHYIVNISMVDATKMIAGSIGWDGQKDEKGRRFLSDIKDAIDRYDDRSFKYVSNIIDSIDNAIIFVHSRQPEDIRRIVDTFNASTLLITNKNIKNINSNHADANVNDYEYDYTIDNSNSLEDLQIKANDFIKKIEGEF